MKIRVAATLVAAVGLSLFGALPASAHTYDHKDPYRSGCGNTKRVVKSAPIKSRLAERVGTIKLMWSSSCKTNWTEVSVPTSAHGTINVYTNRGSDRFIFKAGNGGRHWGNMMRAPGVCAWGGVAVQWNGGRGGQNGQGVTAKACG
ncbi:YjfA family protein [Streptosporangium sp. NBC_01639]|uniref:DUF2690 domain-containing protein n=1 Tax=Streptosporangium sp. NBC_01639 TaxID=2975948 RepID=UPI00386A5D2C|nr:YjfA family protein [Streptosporangium sp. NBC_01639]